MLNNELTHQLNYTSVDDDLQIKNYDDLLQKSIDIEKQYSHPHVTVDNETESRHERTDLNKLDRNLNALRRKKYNEYIQPAQEFKSHVNELRHHVQNASNQLKSGIDDVETQLQKARYDKVKATIHEACQNRGMEDIDVNKKWLTKSMTKRNGAPTSKCFDDIIHVIQVKQGHLENQKLSIENIDLKAKDLDMDASAYVRRFKQDDNYDLVTCLNDMQKDKNDKIEKQKEYQEKNRTVGNKVVNTDTGEFEKLVQKDVHLAGKKQDIEKLRKYASELNIKWGDK